MKLTHLLAAAVAAAAIFTRPAAAQTKDILDAGVVETVKQFNLLDSRHEELTQRAAGMLVFPQVTKGGIAVASEYGEGVLRVAGATAGYYSVASASVGLTAGMASHSEIILFMTPEALDTFMKSKGWAIGADTEITVITRGRHDAYDTYTMKKPVLAFVFGAKGLLADLSLQGTKINKINK